MPAHRNAGGKTQELSRASLRSHDQPRFLLFNNQLDWRGMFCLSASSAQHRSLKDADILLLSAFQLNAERRSMR